MKTVRDLLQDADPLRHEPTGLEGERGRLRQAIVAAASDVHHSGVCLVSLARRLLAARCLDRPRRRGRWFSDLVDQGGATSAGGRHPI